MLLQRGVLALLGFGRRDVADGLQQLAIVELVDPGQRDDLDHFEAAPRSAPMDHFGFGESVDRVGEALS